MERLIHFLRGYVRIKVWGYSPERFMNLCSNRDILLWNIEKHGEYYTMCISITGFRELKPITGKTKTRVAILQRYGLPFFVLPMKKRSIFIIGLLCCLLFLYGMSYYIWDIEITGNSSLTTDVLIDFLKDRGVVSGSRKETLDIAELEKAIRKEFDAVTWTSARLDGTKLVIQIKENDRGMPEIEKPQQEGMDLKATKSGKIVSMVTRSGVPLVKARDEVKEGEILVSGAVPVYGEDAGIRDYLFCRADADIYLECSYSYQEKLPIEYRSKHYTGNTRRVPYIRIAGRELRPPFLQISFAKSDCVVTERPWKIWSGFYLPVSFGSCCYREYELEVRKYTKEQAEMLCQEKLDRVIETLQEKGVQIIQKDVKIKKDSVHYVLQADFIVIEKTGTLAATQTEKPSGDAENGSQAAKEQ